MENSMEEVMKFYDYTIFAYAIGGYCVYHKDEKYRVYYSKTLWECVKYVEENLFVMAN